MEKIVLTISKMFEITSAFIPPTVFYICIPFIALMSLLKIIKEVHG